MDELTEIADRLYAGPADAFTDARNAAAKEIKDKALAAQVKKLKKPSVAAWSMNLLVRRESAQIDSVLELAESAPRGRGGPRRRRAAGADPAAAPAHHGPRVHGALARPRRRRTADRPRSSSRWRGCSTRRCSTRWRRRPCAPGRVLTAFTSTGVSELDVASVVALPDALDVQAVPVDGPAEDETRRRRSRSGCTPYLMTERSWPEPRTRSRRRPVTSPRRRRTWPRSTSSIESLNARRLQLQGEADELRRKLAAIEDDVDQVDDELEEAEEARETAHSILEEAQTCARDGREGARTPAQVPPRVASMSENTAVAYPTHAELLLRYLQRERDNLIGTLDGLSEYDVRRPMTPTGTSLLGLVKHVATVEIGYLGECVGRPWPEPIPWDNDEA